MFSAILLSGLLAATPAQAKKTPPSCHALTEHQLKDDITLSEPCYAVSGFVTIGGHITVEPGVHIVVGSGSTLSFENDGTLTAIGTADKPIVIEGKDHTPGFWRGLHFQTNSSKNQLSYVTVEDVGEAGADSGAVMVGVAARLAMDHTTVRNAEGFGLNVDQRGILAKFEANHFENTGTPLRVKAADLAMIDPATTFANNKKNYVLVYFNECVVSDDATWRALAVPYHFACSPEIKSHLTIEPGAKLEFESNVGIDVTQDGSLSAEGTPDKPIVFTGADETPGFWTGLYFESNSAKNVVSHATIQYAGQDSSISGGVCIGVNAGAKVSDSEIGNNAVAGIRVLQNGRLNADAETSNRFHDNKVNIQREN
ncbi:hypothetical protein [Silvibacterium sp.]|uniref:hypothetical protein n=1 Tax=Silvibacterium sp. TaxID=1964179 RepID=UPI0039E6543C